MTLILSTKDLKKFQKSFSLQQKSRVYSSDSILKHYDYYKAALLKAALAERVVRKIAIKKSYKSCAWSKTSIYEAKTGVNESKHIINGWLDLDVFK